MNLDSWEHRSNNMSWKCWNTNCGERGTSFSWGLRFELTDQDGDGYHLEAFQWVKGRKGRVTDNDTVIFNATFVDMSMEDAVEEANRLVIGYLQSPDYAKIAPKIELRAAPEIVRPVVAAPSPTRSETPRFQRAETPRPQYVPPVEERYTAPKFSGQPSLAPQTDEDFRPKRRDRNNRGRDRDHDDNDGGWR